jgi:hypothetical protein
MFAYYGLYIYFGVRLGLYRICSASVMGWHWNKLDLVSPHYPRCSPWLAPRMTNGWHSCVALGVRRLQVPGESPRRRPLIDYASLVLDMARALVTPPCAWSVWSCWGWLALARLAGLGSGTRPPQVEVVRPPSCSCLSGGSAAPGGGTVIPSVARSTLGHWDVFLVVF